MKRNRKQGPGRGVGFTLIELLVAIGIIAALIGMFFMGYKYWSASAKGNQTKVALQTLRGMLEAYETHGGNMDKLTGPNGVYPTVVVGPNTTVATLATPGMITEDSADRKAVAVEKTRTVMKILLTVPDNRKIYDGLPRGTPGAKSADEQKTGSGMVWETDKGPVLLDAWNNPIIYVPGGGLTGVGLQKTSDGPPPTFKNANQRIRPPGGTDEVGKPFFASAGEDGSVLKGDDNKYSFEN